MSYPGGFTAPQSLQSHKTEEWEGKNGNSRGISQSLINNQTGRSREGNSLGKGWSRSRDSGKGEEQELLGQERGRTHISGIGNQTSAPSPTGPAWWWKTQPSAAHSQSTVERKYQELFQPQLQVCIPWTPQSLEKQHWGVWNQAKRPVEIQEFSCHWCNSNKNPQNKEGKCFTVSSAEAGAAGQIQHFTFWVSQFGSQLWFMKREQFPFWVASMIWKGTRNAGKGSFLGMGKSYKHNPRGNHLLSHSLFDILHLHCRDWGLLGH